MTTIFKECCVCHCKTYHNSKYCDDHRRRVNGRSKAEWESEYRPRKTPFYGVYSALFTVIHDPDNDAGYPPGAILQGQEVRRLVEVGYLTEGAILLADGKQLKVEGKQFSAQRLVMA